MSRNRVINTTDQSFLSKTNFDEVIERICQRLSSRKHYLSKVDFGGSDLKIILQNADEFYKHILEYFRHYHFESSPLNKIQIMTNKKRDIYISTWSERIILMMAQNTISKLNEAILIDEVFSFRKSKGPFTARERLLSYLKTHQKHELYLFQGDIKSYGDNIDQAVLLNLVETKLRIEKGSHLYQVIKASISSVYHSESGDGVLLKGIPSGSPLVPALENLYMSDLDQRIKSLPDMFYARYGDDFLFLNPQRDQIKKAEEILSEELSFKKVEVKKEKTSFILLTNKTQPQLVSPKKYFEWIGFSFHHHGESQIKEKHLKLIKKNLHHEVNHFLKKISKSQNQNLIQSISSGVELIYKSNPDLKKLLKDTTDDKFIRIFISNERAFIKKMISYHFKLNAKASWKIIRSLHFGVESIL